jgi:acyl-homoserine-lactone acylase
VLNPPNGWIMNTNDWPYAAAGPSSPKRENYPRYMDTAGENPRGVHATLVLQDRKDFTLSSLNAAAFDSYLPTFPQLIPALVAAYDSVAAANPLSQSSPTRLQSCEDGITGGACIRSRPRWPRSGARSTAISA